MPRTRNVVYLPDTVSPSGFHVAVNVVIGLVDGGWGDRWWWWGSMEPVHTFFGAPLGYPWSWAAKRSAPRTVRRNEAIVLCKRNESTRAVYICVQVNGWRRYTCASGRLDTEEKTSACDIHPYTLYVFVHGRLGYMWNRERQFLVYVTKACLTEGKHLENDIEEAVTSRQLVLFSVAGPSSGHFLGNNDFWWVRMLLQGTCIESIMCDCSQVSRRLIHVFQRINRPYLEGSIDFELESFDLRRLQCPVCVHSGEIRFYNVVLSIRQTPFSDAIIHDSN